MEPNASGRIAVEELPVDRAREEIESGGVILLDTREPHEHSAAHIEGCILIPPAMVVDNVGQQIPDRSARVIVYCAAGMRSEAAARQMVEMGYEDVVNMTGGIAEWQQRGFPVVSEASLTPEQRNRYSRHILLPEVGADGQVRMLESKALLLGAGGLGAPTAL
jgi:rhodanese-related sulfurtransferase